MASSPLLQQPSRMTWLEALAEHAIFHLNDEEYAAWMAEHGSPSTSATTPQQQPQQQQQQVPAFSFGKPATTTTTTSNKTDGLTALTANHQRSTRGLSCMVSDERELYVAVGRQIRRVSLVDFKRGVNAISAADLEEYLETLAFHTLEVQDIDFDIRKMVINQRGKLMAVVGDEKIVIIALPKSWKVKEEIVPCKSFVLGEFYHINKATSKVVKVLWHPLSPSSTHIMVMTQDGILRMYNVTVDVDEPEQVFKFGNQGFSTAASYASDLDAMEAASFCIGNSHSTWSQLTVYALMQNGDVYSMCPVMPDKSRMSIEALNTLQYTIESTLSTTEDVEQMAYQSRWIAAIQESVEIMPTSDEEVIVSRPPVVRGKVQRQGPYLFQPVPFELDDETNVACDILTLNTQYSNVITIAYSSGKVDVCLELNAPHGQWDFSDQTIKTEMPVTNDGSPVDQLPVLSVYETIDLGLLDVFGTGARAGRTAAAVTPSSSSSSSYGLGTAFGSGGGFGSGSFGLGLGSASGSSAAAGAGSSSQRGGGAYGLFDAKLTIPNHPTLVEDPLYPDSFYVYHQVGAHYVSIKPWLDRLYQLSASALEENKDEATLVRETTAFMSNKVPSKIGWIVNTRPIKSSAAAPVIGMVAIKDIYLGYSVLLLTSSLQLIGLELALRNESEQQGGEPTTATATPAATRVDNGAFAATSKISTAVALPRLDIPGVTDNLPLQPRVVVPPSIGSKPIEVNQETLEFLAKAFEGVRKSLRQLYQAGDILAEQTKSQVQEFERQRQLTTKPEDVGKTTTQMKRLMAQERRHEDLTRRSDVLLEKLATGTQLPLSDAERQWGERMEKNQKEAERLERQGNLLAEQYRILTRRAKALEASIGEEAAAREEVQALRSAADGSISSPTSSALAASQRGNLSSSAYGISQLKNVEVALSAEAQLLVSTIEMMNQLTMRVDQASKQWNDRLGSTQAAANEHATAAETAAVPGPSRSAASTTTTTTTTTSAPRPSLFR